MANPRSHAAGASPAPPTEPSSPSFFFSSVAATAPAGGSTRLVAIAVDLSEESAYAVRWAVQHYLRPGDAVVLLHVRPTSILYGADWGATHLAVAAEGGNGADAAMREDDLDAFTVAKAQDLARPLADARIAYTIHVVKDHDMKERLCIEAKRLGVGAMIMGSRGVGASRRVENGLLGSVSDYCVRHCGCHVIVVRYPDDGAATASATAAAATTVA